MGTVVKMKDRWGSRTVKQALSAANTEIILLQKNVKVNRIYIQNIRRINIIRSRYQKCVKADYGNLTITCQMEWHCNRISTEIF